MKGHHDLGDEREETIRLQREQIESLQEKRGRLEEELASYRKLAEELPRLREPRGGTESSEAKPRRSLEEEQPE